MAYPQAQPPTRRQTLRRKLCQAPDRSDGARGRRIEAPALLIPTLDWGTVQEPLETFRTYLHRLHTTSPRHLLQERPLLSDRLEQRRREARKRDLERQARKPGAASDIQVRATKFNPTRQIQALAKVPRNTFLRRANRRQVDSCVPPKQEIEVGDDLAELVGSQIKDERSQQVADVALGRYRHKRHCNSRVNICRRVDIQHK